MEIERKFLIKSLPDNLESYSCDTLIQAYISTEPVIRVRKKKRRLYSHPEVCWITRQRRN